MSVTKKEFKIIMDLLDGEPLVANWMIDSKKLPDGMIGIAYQGDGPITREFAEKFFMVPVNCRIIEREN